MHVPKRGRLFEQKSSRAYKGFLFQADVLFHLDTRSGVGGTRDSHLGTTLLCN